jgi:CBS domain-containing protein
MAGERARHLQAGAVAWRDVPTCRLDARLSDVRAQVEASRATVCIVIDERRVVLGRLGRAAWKSRRPAASVERAMEIPITYRPDTLLRSLLDRGHGEQFVITDSDGVLIGLVDRRDARRRLAEDRRPRGRARRVRRAPPARRAGSGARAARARTKTRT